MRSRFVYYVLGSVFVHVLVLGFPFSVRTGGLGSQAMLPVRVHLLAGGSKLAGSQSGESRASVPTPTGELHEQDATGSGPGAIEPPSTKAIRTAMRSSRSESERRDNSPRPRAATMPPKPSSTEPARIALKTPRENPKVSTAYQKSATRRNTATQSGEPSSRATATIEGPRERAQKERASLRTTTVYEGSAGAAAKATGNGPAGTGHETDRTGVEAPALSHSPGGSARARSDSLTHVRYARIVKPEYPEQARTSGWEGTTILTVLVDSAGKSERVRVQHTSGFHVLDDAAVNAMRRWEFHPARYGQEAVQSWVSIPVVFKLKGEN